MFASATSRCAVRTLQLPLLCVVRPRCKFTRVSLPLTLLPVTSLRPAHRGVCGVADTPTTTNANSLSDKIDAQSEVDVLACPDPVLLPHDRFIVVRDDMCEGGTKRRVLEVLVPQIDQDEIVYAGHAYGYAALAMALAAQKCGKRVHVFYPSPIPWSRARDGEGDGVEVEVFERTIAQPNLTWSVQPVRHQHELVAAAKAYAKANNAYFMPIGCASPAFRDGLVQVAKSLPIPAPKEVWCMCGSGLLSSALAEAWPDAKIIAVSLGMSHLVVDRERVVVYEAPEEPEEAAEVPPPYPSALYYDAKIWRFAAKFGSEGALIWNVS